MTNRLFALLALAALATPAASHAEGAISGSQLMQACTSAAVPDHRQCVGYIAGAADQIAANPSLKGTLCPLPQGTELKDVKAALVRYGREHADKVGQPAIALLNDVLHERYPCK